MWQKSMSGNSGFSGFPGFLKPKYPEKPEIPNSIFKEYTHWFSGRKDFAKDFYGLFKNVRECVRGNKKSNCKLLIIKGCLCFTLMGILGI